MKIVGVIPARFGSTRLPAKPLINIAGKPLLQWVIEGAKESRRLDSFMVATDHQDIARLAEGLGVEAVMTSSDLPTGSDRVWAAIQNKKADVILNIQGDEPLITGELLDQLAAPFLKDSSLEMATLGRPLKDGDLEAMTTAKVVLNQNRDAIYFSRLPIPYSRQTDKEVPQACLKHIGLYAYKRGFLERFCQTEPVPMELAEGLEQLRALYLGARIHVVEVDHEAWGVDTPDDVKKIEKLLS